MKCGSRPIFFEVRRMATDDCLPATRRVEELPQTSAEQDLRSPLHDVPLLRLGARRQRLRPIPPVRSRIPASS